jgi:hypothetical protein
VTSERQSNAYEVVQEVYYAYAAGSVSTLLTTAALYGSRNFVCSRVCRYTILQSTSLSCAGPLATSYYYCIQ